MVYCASPSNLSEVEWAILAPLILDYQPKKRCGNMAMKMISMSKPTMASPSATLVRVSLRWMSVGKKRRTSNDLTRNTRYASEWHCEPNLKG